MAETTSSTEKTIACLTDDEAADMRRAVEFMRRLTEKLTDPAFCSGASVQGEGGFTRAELHEMAQTLYPFAGIVKVAAYLMLAADHFATAHDLLAAGRPHDAATYTMAATSALMYGREALQKTRGLFAIIESAKAMADAIRESANASDHADALAYALRARKNGGPTS